MLSHVDILEIALRGASAGACILMAVLIFASAAPRMRRITGALFLFGTFVYILISAGDPIDILGPATPILKPFAVMNSVFFWWFARSFFDDEFQLNWVNLAPLPLVASMHFLTPVVFPAGKPAEEVLHNVIIIGLVLHAIWIALKYRADDLIDPRRRFRAVFAMVVGTTTVIIAFAEIYFTFNELSVAATRIQAVAVSLLVFSFACWTLRTSEAFFQATAEPALPQSSTSSVVNDSVPAADQAAHSRLIELMDGGVYREEGLSVALLAQKVGIPEHQLRKLINQRLGFQNFSAFVNERRIADAKAMLADPDNASKQVLQIAMDLGFGSIAPFNRSFKKAVGQTPTEFRKNSLGH